MFNFFKKRSLIILFSFLFLILILPFIKSTYKIKGDAIPSCLEEPFKGEELECGDCQFKAPRESGFQFCTIKGAEEGKCERDCVCDVSESYGECDEASGKKEIDVYECGVYSYYYEEICIGSPEILDIYYEGDPSRKFAPPGSLIIIEGRNFTNSFQVKIDGIQASILEKSPTKAKVEIPEGVRGCSNDIKLIREISYLNKNGEWGTSIDTASYSNFIVVPKISFESIDTPLEFDPHEGLEGTIVKITSSTGGFGDERGDKWVEIGGKVVEFYPSKGDIIDSWQDNQILAAVPFFANTGKIRVYSCSLNKSAYAESEEDFYVLHYPKISIVLPNWGFSGDKFIIYGNNFFGEDIEDLKVYFIFNTEEGEKSYELNNIENVDKFKIELEISKEDEQNIKEDENFKFSPQNNRVKIKVCTNKGCDISKEWFYLQHYPPKPVLYPQIKEVTPPQGKNLNYFPSQEIEIYGRNFGKSGVVRFASGEEITDFLVWNNNEIKFVLPDFDPNERIFNLPIEVCTKFGCTKSNIDYIYSYNEIFFEDEDSDYIKSLDTNESSEKVLYRNIPEIYEIEPRCVNYGGKLKIYGKSLINSKVYFKDKDSNWIETPKYYKKELNYLEVKVPEREENPISSEIKVVNEVKYISKEGDDYEIKNTNFDNYSKQKVYISSSCIEFNCSSDTNFPYINKVINIGSLKEDEAWVGEDERLHLNEGVDNLGIVKIEGCNFGDSPRSSFVLFNDTYQIENFENPRIYSWSNSEIILRVPFGATSGNLKVLVFTGEDYLQSNSKFFNVLPTIQKILPKSGQEGQFITILGSDFCEQNNCSEKPDIKFGIWTKGSSRWDGRITIPGKKIDSFDIYLLSSRKIVLKLPDVISGMVQITRKDGKSSLPLYLASNYSKDKILDENNYFEKIPKIDYIYPSKVNQNEDHTIRIFGEGFNSKRDLVESENEYTPAVRSELDELISKSNVPNALRIKLGKFYIRPVYQYKENLRKRAGFVLSKYFDFGRHNLILENFDGAFHMYCRYGYDKPIDRVINSVNFDLLDESKVLEIEGDSLKEYEGQYFIVFFLEIGCQTTDCLLESMGSYQNEFLDDIDAISNIKKFTRIYKGEKYKIDENAYVRKYILVYPLRTIFETEDIGYFRIRNFTIDISLPYYQRFGRIECNFLKNNIDFSKQDFKSFLRENLRCKYLNSTERYIHKNTLLDPAEKKKSPSDKFFAYGVLEDNYILVDLPIPKIDKVYFDKQQRILTILGNGFSENAKVILGKWELEGEVYSDIIRVRVPEDLTSGVYEIYVKNPGLGELLDKNSNVLKVSI